MNDYIWFAELGKIYVLIPEAATKGALWKKVFLEISQNSQENKKYYKIFVFWKVFKKLCKAINESSSSNVSDRFYSKRCRGRLDTKRALQGHLSTDDTQALEHLRHSGTLSVLRHLGTQSIQGTQEIWAPWALEGHLDIKTFKALGHLSTQALRHSRSRRPLGHSGTQALGHLGTRGTWGILFSRLIFKHVLFKKWCQTQSKRKKILNDYVYLRPWLHLFIDINYFEIRCAKLIIKLVVYFL